MANDPRQGQPRPAPPRPGPPARPGMPARGGPGPRAGRPGPGAGGAKHSETEAHAKEIREVQRGRDIVEKSGNNVEHRPAPFQNPDMLVVRSWMQRRPLEPTQAAAALVQFPRMWTTKRGRYCRFQAPGAGAYGLVRARPTF